MTALLIYLLKVITCSALFAGCYWLALRNEHLFQWNRFYIIVSVALSIIIPLLNITLYAPNIVMPAMTDYAARFVFNLDEVTAVETSSVSWAWLGWALCMFFTLLLLIKEGVAFMRILRLKRRSERIHIPEAVLYCTDNAMAPFTFFRSIFWKNEIPVDSGEGRCILRHELAHMRLGHSWDKTLMQLVCCVFWMNPFFLLFRRELELVHEFAADSESSAEELSSLILGTLYPNYYHDFASRFFQSNIKRRIFMITKNKKLSMNLLRKMSIIPATLVAFLLFAFSTAQPPPQREVTAEIEMLESEIFTYVDEMPEFPGGFEALLKFIGENLRYPKNAMENNIQGSVLVVCRYFQRNYRQGRNHERFKS